MNNQKRFQPIAVCFLFLWLSACNVQTKISSITPTSTLVTLTGGNLPSIPTPQPEVLRAMIIDSFEKQEAVSWRYNSTTQLSNGEIHTTLVEFQPPHRYHIVSDEKNELTIIDKEAYVLQDNQWIRANIPIDSIIDPEASQRLEKSIKDIIFIGSEYLNEKAMLVCRYHAKQKTGDAETEIEVTLWLGNEDLMPYKMLVNGKTMAIDGQTGDVKGIDSTSTVLFEYDPNIEIISPVSQ